MKKSEQTVIDIFNETVKSTSYEEAKNKNRKPRYLLWDDEYTEEDYAVYKKSKEHKDYIIKTSVADDMIKERNAYIAKSKDRKKLGKWLEKHHKVLIAAVALGVGGFFALSGGIGVLPVGTILGLPVGLGAWHLTTSYFKKIYPDANRGEVIKKYDEIVLLEEELKKAQRQEYYDYCKFIGVKPHDCDVLDDKIAEYDKKIAEEESRYEAEESARKAAEEKERHNQKFRPYPEDQNTYDDQANTNTEDDFVRVDNEEPYDKKDKGEDNAVQMTDEEVMRMLQNTSYNQNVTQEPEWASDQDVINSNPYDRPQDGGRGRR